VPWLPELFSAPVLQQFLDKRRRDKLVAVPYFDGLMAGDPGPLVESFAGEPEVHDPMRGRIKGVAAFTAFVTETSAWLRQHRASVEDVEHLILERRGCEEVVLHLDTDNGTVGVPIVVVADRRLDGRIDELRIYFSSRPLIGRRATRPPLLQADPGLPQSDAVGAYLHAFATGDVAAIVAAFDSEGYLRDAEGRQHSREGPDGVSAYYQRLFSTGGGIPLESCALVDDGRKCVLEYNVVGGAPRGCRLTLGPGSSCVVTAEGSQPSGSTTTPFRRWVATRSRAADQQAPGAGHSDCG
jgi:SnoaL-like domain